MFNSVISGGDFFQMDKLYPFDADDITCESCNCCSLPVIGKMKLDIVVEL